MDLATLTITEALAEVKTIGKRIESKRAFIRQHYARQEQYKDPLESAGGGREVIARERQAIRDLTERVVAIRRAIAAKNATETLTIGKATRTIGDWLTWRREAAPVLQKTLTDLSGLIQQARQQAQQKGLNVVAPGAPGERQPTDVIINLDEVTLAAEIEDMETVLGALDGKLSLKNATLTIDV